MVKLPDNVSFEAAARFGYFGTAYAALKKIGVGPGQTLLINGISGQLGLNAASLALAMGATKILGTGRNARNCSIASRRWRRTRSTSSLSSQCAIRQDAAAADPLVAWAKKRPTATASTA